MQQNAIRCSGLSTILKYLAPEEGSLSLKGLRMLQGWVSARTRKTWWRFHAGLLVSMQTWGLVNTSRFLSIMLFHQEGLWVVLNSFCSMTMTPNLQPEESSNRCCETKPWSQNHCVSLGLHDRAEKTVAKSTKCFKMPFKTVHKHN